MMSAAIIWDYESMNWKVPIIMTPPGVEAQ